MAIVAFAAPTSKPSAAGGSAADRTTVFARVTADGALAGGLGAMSARLQSRGDYRVTFSRSIKRCALTATMLAPRVGSYEEIGGVQAGAISDKTVRVVTYNKVSEPVSKGFHLVGNCKTRAQGDPQGAGGASAGASAASASTVALVHWARVRGDGTLGSNSGVASASRTTGGDYRVTFDTPITDCALTATMIAPASNDYESVGGIEAVATGTRIVRVVTYNQPGGPVSNDFSLVATCPL